MTAFPSLGITDMDIAQALLCVLIYVVWRAFSALQSAGKEIAGQLESLKSLLESKFEDLSRSLESIEALILDSERPQ